MTILSQQTAGSGDDSPPETLALAALGWALAEDARAQRLLALTGLDAQQLRSGLEDPTILAAVLEFLANHEPYLIAAAGALGTTPEAIVAAYRSLAR